MQKCLGRDIEPADYPDFRQIALTKYSGLQKYKSLLLI